MEIKKEDLFPSSKYLDIVKKAEEIGKQKLVVKKQKIDKDTEYRLFLKQKNIYKKMYIDTSYFDTYWELFNFVKKEFNTQNDFKLKIDLMKVGYIPLCFLLFHLSYIAGIFACSFFITESILTNSLLSFFIIVFIVICIFIFLISLVSFLRES